MKSINPIITINSIKNSNKSNNILNRLGCLIIIISLNVSFLSGCSSPNNKTVSKSGFYFDTIINITLYDTNESSYIDNCFEIAAKYESLLSNTIADSDVNKINENAGKMSVEVSDETIDVINAGIKYGEISDGLFDITVGNLTDLWNFSEIAENAKDENNEVDVSYLPSDNQIASTLSHINYKNIIIDGNTVMLTDSDSKLDLGGIAKGFIADKMKEYLISQGVTSGFINLGGNVLTLGEKSNGSNYTIGIQKPFDDSGNAITTIEVKDKSVVTSGIYERYYRIDGKLYHHILDVNTGYPFDNGLYSVTIISNSSMDGDALSTTCFALGLENGMALIESMEDIEAIFVTNNYEVISSSGI